MAEVFPQYNNRNKDEVLSEVTSGSELVGMVHLERPQLNFLKRSNFAEMFDEVLTEHDINAKTVEIEKLQELINDTYLKHGPHLKELIEAEVVDMEEYENTKDSIKSAIEKFFNK